MNDLSAAKAFSLALGLEVQGEGEWLDLIVGLNEVRTAYVYLRMPEGQANQGNRQVLGCGTKDREAGRACRLALQPDFGSFSTSLTKHTGFVANDKSIRPLNNVSFNKELANKWAG